MKKYSPYLLFTGLALPFVGKPVHVDDANFIAMAQHARVDPWRPLDFEINWQGTSERAFDVLSNPPGIAWWLAPVAEGPVWLMHLAMLPWLWLAIWGAMALGERVAGRRLVAAVLLLGAPAAMVATTALTPDLPLLACTLAGMGGLMRLENGRADRHRWLFALLLGMGALFRYSGVVLIALAVLWPLLNGERKRALRWGVVAALPLLALMGHDLWVHGRVHLIAMVDFQGVANTGAEVFHKFAANLATLGAGVVLPILCWARPKRSGVGLMVGGIIGVLALVVFPGGTAPVWTVLCIAAGGAVLGGAWVPHDRVERFLFLWLLLGFGFLLALRFSATRYWLPFFAPAVLILLRHASRRSVQIAVVLTPLLGGLLAVDDWEFAHAQQRLAAQVMAFSPDPGRIAGHWGFQHHLESADWVAFEDDSRLASNSVLAVSAAAWPQRPEGCTRPLAQWAIANRWPGPRVHTRSGQANLHGFLIAGDPPQATFAPWGFGDDPMDTVRVVQGCETARSR